MCEDNWCRHGIFMMLQHDNKREGAAGPFFCCCVKAELYIDTSWPCHA